jgi:hypothetical protein
MKYDSFKKNLFPFLKERVIASLKIVKLKVCLFVCPSQSDLSKPWFGLGRLFWVGVSTIKGYLTLWFQPIGFQHCQPIGFQH